MPTRRPLWVVVYRYFFYAWLFRDADRGNAFERSAALRYNREQARWLPTYLWRWLVTGAVVLALEQGAEQVAGPHSLAAAALAMALIFVLMFHLVTAITWAFLRAPRPLI